jgi:hypothetical protein
MEPNKRLGDIAFHGHRPKKIIAVAEVLELRYGFP